MRGQFQLSGSTQEGPTAPDRRDATTSDRWSWWTPRRLVLYGFVVALVTSAFIEVRAPRPWPIQGSRESQLVPALNALNAGGPPLLLRLPPSPTSHGNARFAQAGASDDQGLYLYVPVASHVLGVKDPLVTLRWLYIACFFIPLVLYPLVFFRLFDSPVAGLIAPIPLIICAAELFLRDIYWIDAWSTLTLLPLLMLLDQKWPRRGLLLALLIMVAASFATSIRSQSGLPVLFAAALVLLARPWSWPRRLTGIGLLAIAYLSISTFGLAAVRSYRDGELHGTRLANRQTTTHLVWHPAYLGLGYLPNKYGIRFNDSVGDQAARREHPGVVYGSPAYERTIRKLFFKTVREDPWLFLRVTAQKAVVIAFYGGVALAWLALLLPTILTFGPMRRRMRRYLLLAAPALALSWIPPLVAVPFVAYQAGWFAALALASVVVLCWAARAFTDLPGPGLGARIRETRAHVRAVFAQEPKRARRTAAISVAAVVALIPILGLAPGIISRSDRWTSSPAVPRSQIIREVPVLRSADFSLGQRLG